ANISVGSGAQATILGDGNTINLGAGASANVNGLGNTFAAASGAQFTYAGGSPAAVAVDSSGHITVGINASPITSVTIGESGGAPPATVGNNSFSENLAEAKVVVDAIGVVNFLNGTTGQPLQTLAPTTDGGVAQGLYNPDVAGQLAQKNFFGAD